MTAGVSLVAPPLHAQLVRSWLPWRTIETAHFAFHYPVELEAWTRYTAAHAEAIDSAVSRIVGYSPARKTNVVVDDPYETSNGSAWPFLNRPIINLWATPPDPRPDIGEYRQWGEMLMSHEFTHIAHLSRPSRNAFMRHLWQALPVDLGPIAIESPRWVIEGYATYVEGRVTGSGRPHGAWRAAFLRQWALEGTLPRYDQLDASGAYAGGEFAYLAGSAFLEWLAARQDGDSSLVHVWRRLTAKQTRSFDEAFAGVFGESPAALYGRFVAELTGEALEVERAMRAAGSDTGTIVQRLARSTGDPAISHDGKRVALVQRSATMPSRVVVWSTAPEPDTGRARRDSIMLARDPQDVPARPMYPPRKKALAALIAAGGAPYEGPRFLQDGRILVWRYAARGDGSLASDVYLWDPERKAVRRITHGASVRDADPLPGGRSAIATRCRRGQCDLVTVNLETGALRVITPGSATLSFYRPRVSPDGSGAVVAVHTTSGWRLAIVDLATGIRHDVSLGSPGNAYDASWSSPATLVYTTDESGVPQLDEVNLLTGSRRELTHVTGAAVAPEMNPADGSVWFLSLYSRGYDVRRVIRPPEWSARQLVLPPQLVPAVPLPAPSPDVAPTFGENAVSEPRAFGLAPRQFRWIPAPLLDADGVSAAVSLSTIDIIGRSELLAKVAAGDRAAWRGGAIDANWRGTRPNVRLQAFAAAQRPNESRSGVIPPFDLDVQMAGGEAGTDGSHDGDAWTAHYRAVASAARLRRYAAPLFGMDAISTSRTMLSGEGAIGFTQRRDAASFGEVLAGSIAAGRSFDTRFSRAIVSGAIGTAGAGILPVSGTVTYGRTNAGAPPFEQLALGGSPSPLVDRLLLTQRIAMPVLPTAISVGSSALSYRVSLDTRPLAAYVWAGSTAPGGARFASWHRVVGLDWTASVPAFSLAGTPAARAQLGFGQSLDAPFRRKVRAYVGLVIDP